MSCTPPRLALGAALFAALLFLGGWPSAAVARAFSAAYCPLANLLIAHQTFGRGGRARLAPVDRIQRGDGDNVTADATIALRVDGYQGALPLGMSLRRDVYLPLLILTALLIATPLGLRRRLLGLAVAVPVLLLWSLVVIQILVVWLFATKLAGIYAISPRELRVVDLAYEALLAPPGNRFIVPMVVGIGAIAWQASRPPRSLA